MLTLWGQSVRYCDGIPRRAFLKAGALGLGAGALTLADVFRAEASANRASHKAVINVFLGGGPPHQDMWEIKTDAPSEIRGEFQPIATAVPGIQICEVFPTLAGLMDKSVVIRSVVGAEDRHESFQCFTGWRHNELSSIGGRPCVGSAISRLKGPVDLSVPPFVGLAEKTQHGPWSDPGRPGYLGAAFSPFKPDGEGMANMRLGDLAIDRLSDRRALLTEFDRLRHDLDVTGQMAGVDAYGQRALDVLTSSKLVDALDLSKEDPRIREKYGDGKPFNYQYDGAPTVNEHLLIARRLVEADVRCVTLTFGRWDSHGQNFKLVRDHGGKLDQALGTLIEDLDQRGMLNEVTVIAWGEFGRTPRINGNAGRDHWPQVSCAFLAGGGMRTGQAIGSTNRLGEHAQDRPVHIQEVVATLYHNLGVDTSSTTLKDPTGRPQYLVEKHPLPELL
jgi:hypothetical protein